MPTRTSQKLRLPSLTIKGFRGIDNLEIPRLGRVTLFVGKNGVGKTTLLEAVQVYAARGHYRLLAGLLQNREEFIAAVAEDGNEVSASDWASLFHGRDIASNPHITIGPKEKQRQLHLQTTALNEKTLASRRQRSPYVASDDEARALRIQFQEVAHNIPFRVLNAPGFVQSRWEFTEAESGFAPGVRCESLGPSLPNNVDLARFWDHVALTDDENRAVKALNLIFDDKLERVAVVGNDPAGPSPYGRRAVVKIKGQWHPVPLKSLGDGATRLFGVALALANSGDGFLVIDEAENGIHYSVQCDFWKMVLRTAHENNAQVLATTHSWDCAASFAYAAVEVTEVDGVLIRLEQERGQVRAIEYSEDDLQTAAQQGIEVR